MESVLHIKMRRAVAVAGGVAALALAGCGSDNSYKNENRPPSLIVVPAAITDSRVSVSPAAFGAGPINLIVSNQSATSQRVTIQSTGEGNGFRAQTGPINPGANAELKVDTTPGPALVKVDGAGIRAAHLKIGAARPTAQNELLQP